MDASELVLLAAMYAAIAPDEAARDGRDLPTIAVPARRTATQALERSA